MQYIKPNLQGFGLYISTKMFLTITTFVGIVGTSVKSKKNLGAMRILHDQERIGFWSKKKIVVEP